MLPFQDFNVAALEKFIEASTVPTVTVWNSDPSNHPYINKFFEAPGSKVLLVGACFSVSFHNHILIFLVQFASFWHLLYVTLLQ